MSNALLDRATILVHIIFSTKDQAHLIDPQISPLLYACIEGILWEPFYSPAFKTGGGTDHVHILLALSRTVTPDALIKAVKERSRAFMRSLGGKYADWEWQEGYAVFTISRSEADEVMTFISGQQEYHCTVSFQEEYRSILTENGIEYDESEMWD